MHGKDIGFPMLMHGDCLKFVFSSLCAAKAVRFARMAELVDAANSKFVFVRVESSNLSLGTIIQ
jgi:hypothetical protein